MKKFILLTLLMISLFGCTSLSTKNENILNGKEYVLINNQEDVKITIGFAEDNFFGFSGVNNYFGKYEVSGNNIKFLTVGSTLMAGPENLSKLERIYIKKLENTKAYKIEKSNLILITSDNESMKFKIQKN